MATLALVDCTTFVDGYDLTSDTNAVQFDTEAAELDDTAFGDSGRSRIGGLLDCQYAYEGFQQFADPDATLKAALGSTQVVTNTVDGSDGATAYFAQGLEMKYMPLGGNVGDVAPLSVSGAGTNGWGAIAGKLLYPKQTIAGNDNGTNQQLGAVAADEFLYTAIHCFTAGTTLDVVVESDDNSGHSSSTSRSDTTITGTGGTWVTRVAGPITDDHWRVRIETVTGSFSVAVAVGIE